MFFFTLSTLEDSEPERDERCFLSEVSQFLFRNEFEETAANYKESDQCKIHFFKEILIQTEMEEILKSKKYPPITYRRLKAFG